jgi:hypothetical protein
MRRYLVVANQTLGGGHLVGKVRECLQDGPCGFHIVVPATPPRDHWTYTEGEAVAAFPCTLRVRFRCSRRRTGIEPGLGALAPTPGLKACPALALPSSL